MRSIVNENIMEHSEQVAQIAHALAMISNKYFGGNVNADRCVTLAVFHECSEVITGDLPTPIKYYNNDIKIAYKGLESIANNKLLTMLPEEFRLRCLGVRDQPQAADAQSKQIQNAPAQEAEMQAEQPPAVSVHHLPGSFQCLLCRQLGLLGKNVRYHGVAVARHNTGDHEKQGPQEGIQPPQKSRDGNGLPVLEIGKQLTGFRLPLPLQQSQIVPGIAYTHDAAQNIISKANRHHKQKDHRDHTEHSRQKP